MFHIICRPQIGVGLGTAGHAIRLELTDKQKHLATVFSMVDIALAGRRVLCRGALTLPME